METKYTEVGERIEQAIIYTLAKPAGESAWSIRACNKASCEMILSKDDVKVILALSDSPLIRTH